MKSQSLLLIRVHPDIDLSLSKRTGLERSIVTIAILELLG